LNLFALFDLAFFSPTSRVTSRSSLFVGLLTLIAILTLAGLTPGPAGSGQAAGANLIAPTRVCANRTASGGKVAMTRARHSMNCMVNYARRRKHLKRYRVRQQLAWSAGRKARDILRCGFTHTACGRRFDFWIRKSGYLGEGGWATGENIAWGSGNLGNVRSIFIAWMKSKGHREAILSRRFTDLGSGVVRGRFEGLRGARIWVLHFGDN
jgi:uncharacterized protein YkwD